MTRATTFYRFARWGLIGVVALMSAALVVTIWSTNRSVAEASDALLRGQSAVLRGAVRTRGRTAPTADELAALLDEYADDGLRYVGVFGRDGALLAEAGEPVGSGFDQRTPQRIDGRVRVVFGRPGGDRRVPPRARPPRRGRTTVIEFEPRVADQLAASAERSLGLGAIAGAALILFAVVLVRWYARREARERELEQERHLAGLGQMSAVLAHEIRNPVASLKGNAQLLVKMLPDDNKPKAKAARLVDESTRLERLTNDLLDFARAGQLERVQVAPGELLRDAAAAVTDARVDIDDGGAPAHWSLDPQRLRQALTNLIDNARQAADAPVEARVGVDRGRLLFEVRDRGPGIAPDDLDHIFEPFYTRKTRGTGLGLAVARRMVELHGGTISASNAPDGGAVFRISIPAD